MTTKKETKMEEKEIQKKSDSIVIPLPKRTTIKLKIRNSPGIPLVCNRKTKRAMDRIRNKQLMQGTVGKEKKDIQILFEESMHRVNGTYGFPGSGIKNAIVAAGPIGGITMTFLKKAGIYVIGDIVPFTKFSEPKMRDEDFLPVGRGGLDWRIRSQFDEWEMELTILFNANMISKEQIVNLVDLAGFHIGIGEGRPNSKRTAGCGWGLFEVVRQ